MNCTYFTGFHTQVPSPFLVPLGNSPPISVTLIQELLSAKSHPHLWLLSCVTNLTFQLLSHSRLCSVASNSLQPHGLSPTRLLHPFNFPGKNSGVGCRNSSLLSDPGIEPTSLISPALAGGFLPPEPSGKTLFQIGEPQKQHICKCSLLSLPNFWLMASQFILELELET